MSRRNKNVMWEPNDDKWGPTGFFDPEYQGREWYVQTNPRIKRNFTAIIGSLAGDQFSRKEVEKISREVIDNMPTEDAVLFDNVGPSRDGILRLDARQLKAVGRLISTFPHDDLGIKVRNAYDGALRDQRIRVRRAPQSR